MAKPKRIAIIGSTLYGNKGAAAMLEASMQTLERELGEVEFTLYTMYPSEDRRLNTYKNLTIIDGRPFQLGVALNTLALLHRLLPPLRGWLRGKSEALKHLVEADVFIDQSGITFVDGREKFLPYNTASILPAVNVHTPMVKCAQALGPFKNPINRAMAKFFLPRVTAIVSRGRITHEYLEGLKLTNITKGADYAFSLELTAAEEKSARSKFDVRQLAGKRVVGVSPSIVMAKQVNAAGGDYEDEMVAFINHCTGEGYGVMLVPHSLRPSDRLHNNDLPLCDTVHAQLDSPEDVLYLNQELSSQELRYWIGQCDFFVASRFHAMISSLAMGVPTLVIGWSHKYREVLEMFELEEWAFGKDKLSTEYLRSEFNRLVAGEKVVRRKLAEHLPEVKDMSLAQVPVIIEAMKKES